MNQLPTLIRREFWEHKTTFFFVPAITTIVVISLLLIVLVSLQADAVSVSLDLGIDDPNGRQELVIEDSSLGELFGSQLQQLAASPEHVIEDRLDELYTGVSIIWFAVLWIVIFFYLLGALYDDRRDRSVLFWKSLPVSDTLTVASKLAAGLILAPSIYFVFTIIAHLAIAGTASIAAMGQDVPIWNTLWGPANFVSRWLSFVGLYGFTVLWCLPFFAWLLFVSSAVKSVPLAWAVGVPIIVILLEWVIFDSEYIRGFVSQHTFSFEFWQHGRHVMQNFQLPQALEMASSLIVGMVFIGGAVWQRGRADEI